MPEVVVSNVIAHDALGLGTILKNKIELHMLLNLYWRIWYAFWNMILVTQACQNNGNANIFVVTLRLFLASLIEDTRDCL